MGQQLLFLLPLWLLTQLTSGYTRHRIGDNTDARNSNDLLADGKQERVPREYI